MGTAVNHPECYQMGNDLEAIDIVESITYKLKGIEASDMGEVITNICKWSNEEDKAKDSDLENAIWYLQHLLAHRRAEVKKQLDKVTSQIMGGVQA